MHTRIFVIDEHKLFRDGLRALLILENSPIRVVGDASSAQEALRHLIEMECDVVTVGSTHAESAVGTIRLLRGAFPELPFLVLASEGAEQVLEAVQEGASGYLSKSAPISDLLVAIDTVSRGGAYIHPRAANSVFSKIRSSRHRKKDELEIVDREREVLERLANGFNNSQIAQELYLSSSTVKSIIRGLFGKFAVTDRTHLVAMAVRKGLVSPPRRLDEAR